MVAAAWAAGFGDVTDRLVAEWVRLGLLDEAERIGRSDGRRGALYQWPDSQWDLFRTLLAKRTEIPHIRGLVQISVGVWVYWGNKWVPLRQVRRALESSIGLFGPLRSYRRAVANAREVVRDISGPATTRQAAADRLGVVVVAAVGANAQSVGEHALALALALARDVVGHDRRVRLGRWERPPGVELAGRTWGVVGLGATGRATARVAAAVGMEVIGHDAFLPAGAPLGEVPVERLGSMDDVLGRADVVSLHLAASEQTRGMVDGAFLAKMRKGAFLVNVARGELVDEAALLSALDQGQLGGVGLDVRASEPPGAVGSRSTRSWCPPRTWSGSPARRRTAWWR